MIESNKARSTALTGNTAMGRASEISSIARCYFNRGLELESKGGLEEAVSWYDTALAVAPDYFEVHVMRAACLNGLGRFAESLSGFDRAIACKPRHPRMRASLHLSRGTLLFRMRRFLEAIDSYSRAIAIDPRCQYAYYGRGHSRLRIENMSDGFEDFQSVDVQNRPAARWWDGHESLSGKTLLLEPGISLGGVGDAFQFCRYAKLLTDRGSKVILGVRPTMADLIRTFPNITVLTTSDPVPVFDYQTTLPKILQTFVPKVAAIYGPIGYLRASPRLTEQWRKRLGERRQPRVGIAWWTETDKSRQDKHGPTFPTGYLRSIPLRELVAHLPDDFEYVSLQHQVREMDQEALRSSSISHFGAEMTFDAAAAVMECCDLVIAIDSSLAHLAGALGRPVWIALPFMSCWRWFFDRSDSPWYPTARLYRSGSEGDWSDPLKAISADLGKARSLDRQRAGVRPAELIHRAALAVNTT